MSDEKDGFFELEQHQEGVPADPPPTDGEGDGAADGEQFDPELLKSIAGGDDGGGKAPMIPKARLDEVLEENRRLKAQLEAPPEQVQRQADELLDTLEQQREELQEQADSLLMEGDLEQRKAVIKQLRECDRQIARLEARHELERDKGETKAKNDIAAVVSQATATYTFLDATGEQADQVAINAVNSLMQSYVAGGMAPPAALQQAVDELGPVFAVKHGVPTAPDRQRQVREQRERSARERAVDTLNRQPDMLPQRADKSLTTAGKLSARDVASMSEEQKRELFS